MAKPAYVKHSRVTLKGHPELTEKWLQDRIAEDPSILRLPGEPELLERERRQERAGRLDLLLHDAESDRRYEVELMLGSLDESHIIRAIEYWDIERRRYPAYDHVAVLVAEDVTGRFLNILSLLSGTIPLIVLQCQALQVDDKLLLEFVKILDQTSLRRDDEEEGSAKVVTREYWAERVGKPMLSLCDRALTMVNRTAANGFELNYTVAYIGMKSGGRSRNFVQLVPKKKFLHVRATVTNVEEWLEKLKAAGLDARSNRVGTVQVTLSPDDFDPQDTLLQDLLTQAVADHQS